jgi:regulatory protein
VTAKAVAVKLLSRREHSAHEIREKLRQREFDSDEIEQVVEELKAGGWLSDERFAEAYIRMRQLKGFGPVRISMELKERGVDELIVESLLDANDASWMRVLEQQYQKKYRNTAIDDYNEKAKRIRFLQYRGFTLDAIYQVVD